MSHGKVVVVLRGGGCIDALTQGLEDRKIYSKSRRWVL